MQGSHGRRGHLTRQTPEAHHLVLRRFVDVAAGLGSSPRGPEWAASLYGVAKLKSSQFRTVPLFR